MARRIVSLVMASVLSIAGIGVAFAPSASAAYPTCSEGQWLTSVQTSTWAHFRAKVPIGDNVWSCNLQYGDRGQGVKALQSALNACYGRGLVTDGVYGSKTRAAVLHVQRKYSWLANDGKFGPNTRAQMDWKTYKSSPSSPEYRLIGCRILGYKG